MPSGPENDFAIGFWLPDLWLFFCWVSQYSLSFPPTLFTHRLTSLTQTPSPKGYKGFSSPCPSNCSPPHLPTESVVCVLKPWASGGGRGGLVRNAYFLPPHLQTYWVRICILIRAPVWEAAVGDLYLCLPSGTEEKNDRNNIFLAKPSLLTLGWKSLWSPFWVELKVFHNLYSILPPQTLASMTSLRATHANPFSDIWERFSSRSIFPKWL